MIVAHANGTPQSDVYRGRGDSRGVRQRAVPPVTGFKWAFGHLIAAAGIIEAVIALAALKANVVPGIATLRALDPACAGLPVSATCAVAAQQDCVDSLPRLRGHQRGAAGAADDPP